MPSNPSPKVGDRVRYVASGARNDDPYDNLDGTFGNVTRVNMESMFPITVAFGHLKGMLCELSELEVVSVD